MLYLDGIVSLVLLGLWIFCIVEVITTAEADCRNLPKFWWLLIVIVLPTIGSLAWLIGGRPGVGRRPAEARFASGGRSSGVPDYERPRLVKAESADADAEFLRQCRERAEEQRRRYREQRGDHG